MTIITKGMGIIMKKGGGDLLKKSKKFPGPKADEQLQKKVDTRIRRGKRVRGIKGQIGADDIDVHARIGRTQRYRNIAAQTFKAARNPEKYKPDDESDKPYRERSKANRMKDPKRGINSPAFKKFMASQGM